jgi:iron(III) transport system ATP-binding protein
MVFQSYALWPHMTVWKNIAFGLEERRFPKSEIHSRVGAVLDLVDLVDLADRRPSHLSGGQQQRVALARTIVVEPKVLLLDEPLSNLDAKLRIQMRQELLLLQRKLAITTIFVTHDQEEANTTADRIAVMNEGVVQQVGTPTELYDNPANRFVASFIGTANLLDGALSIVDGKPVFRTTDGLTVPLASEAASRMTPGVKGCSIVFRPQNVTIRPAEEGDHQGGDRQGTVSIGGIVQHLEFLGSLIRYTVAVGERKILVDDAHHRGQPALSVGTSATLGLAIEQVILLPN